MLPARPREKNASPTESHEPVYGALPGATAVAAVHQAAFPLCPHPSWWAGRATTPAPACAKTQNICSIPGIKKPCFFRGKRKPQGVPRAPTREEIRHPPKTPRKTPEKTAKQKQIEVR